MFLVYHKVMFLCRYAVYAAPLIETYNNVVGNTLSLLNSLTLDERVNRWNHREAEDNLKGDPAEKNGEFYPLKRGSVA